MLKAEVIVSLITRFLMEVTIIIEVPSRRYKIRHRCKVYRLEKSFGGQVFICLCEGHSKVEKFSVSFLF